MGKINELYKLAQEENDYPVAVLLQWFINEQVEEEASALKMVEDLERVGGTGHGLFMIDRELGSRLYTSHSWSGIEIAVLKQKLWKREFCY